MNVLVTGSSGMIGSGLVTTLRARGDRVVRLVRGDPRDSDAAQWDPEAAHLDPKVFDGIDAVVHLAGQSIGARRWSDTEKRRILGSRTKGTDLLARTLAGLDHAPSALVSASAVGFYGARGDEILTEESAPGDDFMAGVCIRWEAATAPAAAAGMRVAHLRSGVVLSPSGGALARMLLPFKLGLGGRIGRGTQYMSWITLPDEVAAIVHVLDSDLVGPVNLTAPNPVTNTEFARTLGAVLRRPTILPTPLLPLKLRYGSELVRELLLDSKRALPTRLDRQFAFTHPTLDLGLRSLLDR